MRVLLIGMLCVALVTPVAAQDAPAPLPPSLEALRARLRHLQEARAVQPVTTVTEDDAEHQRIEAALARLEAKLVEIDEKDNAFEILAKWFTKPETLTAIVSSVVTVITMLKVRD